jgi:hypothetical protein
MALVFLCLAFVMLTVVAFFPILFGAPVELWVKFIAAAR